MECVFSTRNNTKTQVTWHIGPAGGIQAKGTQAGICSAMSAVWIARSIHKGSPLDNRMELGTQHNIAIVMGARVVGGKDRRWILESQGLTVEEERIGAPTIPYMLLNEMRMNEGYTYFSTGGTGGRHAMAIAVLGSDYYFFDPNFGMYKMGMVEFVTKITDHLNLVYPDLLDDYSWYKVT
ncbi:MAG TPA: YopT-type cysteine protease domain-containing protein [Bryobacteraceae bacterium]|nr:YopT-type cysteine protease domain-containing protein [Terriglobales bacterium]HUI78705.1 YopT-type cysteine protease domain-containing protein [Bryobacteraceae bacterium]